jgi:hypothetical protein
VAAGVVDVVDGADGAARRSGCPRHHQLKGVVAVAGVGRPVAGDGGHAVPGVVSEGKRLAGAGIGHDIAAAVVSVSSESGAVFGHARDPVGDGIIGGKPRGCHGPRHIDMGQAAAHAIIGVN